MAVAVRYYSTTSDDLQASLEAGHASDALFAVRIRFWTLWRYYARSVVLAVRTTDDPTAATIRVLRHPHIRLIAMPPVWDEQQRGLRWATAMGVAAAAVFLLFTSNGWWSALVCILMTANIWLALLRDCRSKPRGVDSRIGAIDGVPVLIHSRNAFAAQVSEPSDQRTTTPGESN